MSEEGDLGEREVWGTSRREEVLRGSLALQHL